jgi:hypothetical protein
VLGTPVRIEISATFANVGAIDAPNGSSYQFDLVPVGDFTVTATEVATGDKGISTSRIGAAGEVKTLNVRLVGQGTVHVTTVDEGAPVAGAKVTVRTSSPVSRRPLSTAARAARRPSSGCPPATSRSRPPSWRCWGRARARAPAP